MRTQRRKHLKILLDPVSDYIYLVQAANTASFKIGRTRNVPERIRQLQTACPLKIRYVYHAYVQDARLCEMQLHTKFSSQREIGEWFALTQEDVKACIFLMRLVQEAEPTEPMGGNFTALKLERNQTIALIQKMRTKLNQTQIIEELWECKKGGSETWRFAYAQFQDLMGERVYRGRTSGTVIQAEPEQNGSEYTESERAERALQLKAQGWGKAKIILEVWGVTKGGSPKYKATEVEYERLVGE